jgi:hypothetical protein
MLAKAMAACKKAAFRLKAPDQSSVKNLDQTFDAHQALLL